MRQSELGDYISENGPFLVLLQKWWTQLKRILEAASQSDCIPVIIAISRKMPRFLEWFKEKGYFYIPSEENIDILKDIEITTELAIPFLSVDDKFNSMEFIILDDSIIHGSTMIKVSENLYHLTEKKCHLSSLLINTETIRPDYIYVSDWITTPKGSVEEVIGITDIVSEIVKSSKLPIDMEFPVLKVQTWKYNFRFIRQMSRTIFGSRAYDVDKSNAEFSIDLTNRESSGKNNDFAKIRFFKKASGFYVEVFSPHIFSEDQLTNTDTIIISDPIYLKIWNESTGLIRSIISRRHEIYAFNVSPNLYHEFVKSLCVWVNYLYSVACLARNYKSILGENTDISIRLSLRDLKYLIGGTMAERFYPLLDTIISHRHTMSSDIPMPMDLPESFSPETFELEMDSVKIISALTSETVDDLFKSVFEYGHFSNPKFSNSYLNKRQLYFGETFSSLEELLYYQADKEWTREMLSAWIDRNIDEGYVIPRYESVKGNDGNVYWRRFFHSGARYFK